MSSKLKTSAEQADQRRTVLERLLRIWNEHPSLSLGRFLQRTTNGVEVEYLFDDELLGLMEQSVPKSVRRVLARELPL